MSYVFAPLQENVFLKCRRDVLLNYANFTELHAGEVETFDIVTKSLVDKARIAALSADKPMISTEERAWEAIAHLHLSFTAGVPVERLQIFFPMVIAYWEEYAAYHAAFHTSPSAEGRRVPHLDLYDKDYWRAIRFTSFAILLGYTDLLPRVTHLWDYENDAMDGLLERLVAPFVPGRALPPDTCTRHLPYFKLLKVFAAPLDKRPALMAKYMDEWYTASRREPYFESHKKGRDHSYLGYWSFEAAAVTYLLDIDDATYRDKDFYPRDMIDFARSLPRPLAIGGVAAQTESDAVRLRVLADERCPREGFWFAPAKIDSRRRFNVGDVMPDLKADYGATIWQWDIKQ